MTNALPKFSHAISSRRAELHAHRPSDRLRQQRRVVGHGVGAVDSVAAGPGREDDTHLLGRQAEQPRAVVSRIGYTAWVADHSVRARLHVGDGAGTPHRAVHVEGMHGTWHAPRCRRRAASARCRPSRRDRCRARFFAPQMVVVGALRRQRSPRRPRQLQLCGHLSRLQRFLGDHADEIACGRPSRRQPMPATEVSSTLASVAPTAGGRTTCPCSMPGTRT